MEEDVQQTGTPVFLDNVSRGNVDECGKQILNDPKVIGTINKKRETALHIIAKRNDSRMLELLLRFNPDTNATNIWGQTPLHYAAEESSFETIKTLLRQPGIEVNQQDVNGYNVLHSYVHSFSGAIRSSSPEWEECLKLLIHAGVDVNRQTSCGNTVLHLLAARTELFESQETQPPLKLVLEECDNIQLNLKDNMKRTFMHSYLALSSSHELLNLFPDRYTEHLSELLNEPDVRGLTPCSTSLVQQSYISKHQLEHLIKIGCSLIVTDHLGNSVLHNCRAVKNVTLVQYGVDINVANVFGITAASNIRVRFSSPEILEVISTINFALLDRWCRNPVFAMIDSEHVCRYRGDDPVIWESFDELFDIIMEDGVEFDINQQDKFGTTLLHLAAYYDDAVIMEVLLSHGANADIVDGLGDTPMDTALKFGNLESFSILSQNCKRQKKPDKYIEYYKSLDEVFLSDIGSLNRLRKATRTLPKNREAFSLALISKHYISFANQGQEAYHVNIAVQELVNRLCAFVGDFDERFHISVFKTGSAAEGTKVKYPDEFDFVLCMTHLSENCEIEMCTNRGLKHCARLKLRSQTVRNDFISFCDEENYFLSEPYLEYLFRYIQRALYQPDLWEKGQLVLSENVNAVSFSAPVINFTVAWVGSRYKHLNISVDLVPAVYKRGWWPPGYLPMEIAKTVRDAGWFVLLETMAKNVQLDHVVMKDSIADLYLNVDGKQKEKQRSYRISVAPAEIALMRSLPENFRKAYALSKMFRSNKFCPCVVIDTQPQLNDTTYMDQGFSYTVLPSKEIKSYWIKNCIFYVADEQEIQLKNATPFSISLQVFKRLLDFVKSGVFRPYLQRCVNLFQADIGVYKIEDNIVFTKQFRETCLLRKYCIETVLAVLRCPVDATENVHWLETCEDSYFEEWISASVEDSF